MDVLRLTCIEAGILICETLCDVILKMNGQDYQIAFQKQKTLLAYFLAKF